MRVSLLFAIGTVAIVMIISMPFAAGSEEWWNANWTYRRKITLGNHPENFQIKILLPFYDSSIRFTENAAGGLLPYWVERYADNEMLVWVRRIDNTDNAIYVYYGNGEAGLAENGDDTFIFFDDFNRPDSETVGKGWTEDVSDVGTIENQKLKVASASNEVFVWHTITTNYSEYAVDAKVTRLAPASADKYMSVYGSNTNQRFSYMLARSSSGQKIMYLTSTAWEDSGHTWEDGIPENLSIAIKGDGKGTYFANYSSVAENVTGYSATNTYKLGFGTDANAGIMYVDDVRVRRYAYPEPIATISDEEKSITYIVISNITADNQTLDRDKDWKATTVTATKVQADVENAPNHAIIQVVFAFYDKNGVLVSQKNASENMKLADNKWRFWAVYDATDNVISDSQLGNWSVKVTAKDNHSQTAEKMETAVFAVYDLSVSLTIENIPGHVLRIFGEVSILGNGTPTVDNLIAVDSKKGDMFISPASSYDFQFKPENSAWLRVKAASGVLDGWSDNKYYAFPNFSPEIVSVSSSKTLIDRKQDLVGSGAVTTTTITIAVHDNDNDSFSCLLKIRDNTDSVVVNVNMGYGTAQHSYYYTYDPDNDIGVGSFDVYAEVTDNYGEATNSGWKELFVVDDLTITINISSEQPYVGWPFTVSGTISRVSGETISVDNSWLQDNYHELLSLGAQNNYSATYTITAPLNTPCSVTVSAKDFPLDGKSTKTYTVNENAKFQIELRWENTGELLTNLSEHNFRVKFWWNRKSPNESNEMPISAARENFVVNIGGENVFLVRVYDNNPLNYWRARVPLQQGGILVFLIPSPDATIYQYAFTLADYTQNFTKGWIRFYTAKGIVNEDWWDAAGYTYAYLQLHGFYSVRAYSEDAKIYELQHFQAETNTAPPPLVIREYEAITQLKYIHDIIKMAGYRNSAGSVAAFWSSADENTTLVTIRIYNFAKDNKMLEQSYAYPTYLVFEWSDAENNASYWLEIETQHNTFGKWSEWFSIGPVVATVLPPPPGIAWGGPVPLGAIAGIFIVMVFAAMTTAEHASTGMIIVGGVVLGLKLISALIGVELMPIPWSMAGLLMVIAVLWKLAEGI